jgi:FMN-dependent NADH-azoreductase
MDYLTPSESIKLAKDFIEWKNNKPKSKLIEIKVNSEYLPTLLDKIQARHKEINDGEMFYWGVPVVIDESVGTFELVYDKLVE